MEKTITIFGGIFDFTAEQFVEKLEEAKNGEYDKVKLLINSPGGSVFSGWSMVQAWQAFIDEFQGETEVMVAGQASSMMSAFLLFNENVHSIVQSRFILHKASLPSFMMEDEFFQNELKAINDQMYKAYKAKIDEEKFTELSGVSLKKFFDAESQAIDLGLSAKQAKSLGLIKKVVNLSPTEAKAINASLIAAKAEPIEFENFEENTPVKMTAEELQKQHPETYKAIYKAGAKAEAERVGAWMAFNEIDSERVKLGIDSGKLPTAKDVSEFTVQALKSGFVTASSAANADEDAGGEGKEENTPNNNEKSAEMKAFEAELEASLKNSKIQ